MTRPKHVAMHPTVHLVGSVDHPEFSDAIDLLHAGAQLVAGDVSPEFILFAQCRPDAISLQEIERHRRRWPLAGGVALLGSWCEGETRTGRPYQGIQRLYWYEFPAWWRRQLVLCSTGRCPDWARWGNFGFTATADKLLSDRGSKSPTIRNPQSEIRNHSHGVILISAAHRETAAVLSDVVRRAGYATVWQRPNRPAPVVRGAVVGIWDGGQLDECEADDLASYCQMLARDRAPVIALLDFPRHDRCQRARDLGAAAVLGKPWLNAVLMEAITETTACNHSSDRVKMLRAAAGGHW